MENKTLLISGWILLIIALFWVLIAQMQMADSWRIGIDTEHTTELVTTGLFSISRNPIFLGVLIADLGLFLILPNAFTLLVAVMSWASIETQVRLEEDFLKEVHGDTYEKYGRQVRRWI